MANVHLSRRGASVLLLLATLIALAGTADQAAGYSPGCGQIPIVYGIPPWGFHTGPPIGDSGSYLAGTAKSTSKPTPSPESCVRKSAPGSTQPARSP